MNNDMTPYRGQLTARHARQVDPPASDEFIRARELATYFAKQLGIAERHGDRRVSINIEEARELCQMLHDSLRTAEQLQRD